MSARERTAGHTPGPWSCGGDEIFSKENYSSICIVLEGPYRVGNRRMIAAAPDLLEALETFVEEYCALVNSGDAGHWDPEQEPKVIAARAALSAASGDDGKGGV